MIQRISGYLRGMIALGLPPLRPVLGIVLFCATADAGMENDRFALDYKPKFLASKTIPNLCDNPADRAELQPKLEQQHSYSKSAFLLQLRRLVRTHGARRGVSRHWKSGY